MGRPPVAVSGLLIFFGLVWAYIIFLFWLVRSGRMQKWNLALMLGVVLMIRTKHGRKTLDRIAKPKRLWNAFGDFGTVFTLLGMVGITFLMMLSMVVALDRESGIEPVAAKNIIIIPGVTEFLPLWYGIAALIITLVVHEGGHGVLARANDMKVKSLGLLYAIVPIGAFVEPDEDELNAAPRRKRLRVFAAGATVNIVVAIGLLFAFAGMVAAAEPVDGVPVLGVTEDLPAHQAGLITGDIILTVNGTSVGDYGDFSQELDGYLPGETVVVGLSDGSTRSITLADRWTQQFDDESRAWVLSVDDPENATTEDQQIGVAICDSYFRDPETEVRSYRDGGDCADQLAMLPFMGIRPLDAAYYQAILSEPFGSLQNFLFYVSMPIGEIPGNDVPVMSYYLPTFYEGSYDGYWIVGSLIFWTFWINLMVGLTNILPMLPLDGGHIFRDAVGGIAAKIRPDADPTARDRVVGRLAGAMSFIILGAFLVTVLGPRFV